MLNSFLNVSEQVAVLFILIGVGYLLSKLNIIKEQGVRVMTDIVLYAVTPCVIIGAFQRPFEADMLKGLCFAALSAFLVMLFSVFIAELIYRKTEIDKAVVLKFAVVFSNAGFMALPLQQAILGSDGVFYGAAYVAVFNIFMWTYGIVTMSGRKEKKEIIKAVVNPGIIGTAVGVLLFVFKVELPTLIKAPVDYLSALNTPVPMLIIGFYLSSSKLTAVFREKGAYPAMALRLVFIPLCALGALYLTGVDPVVRTSVVIAASAPVAAFTTMMSSKFERDTQLSAGIVSASTLISLITMPLVVGLSQMV